MGDFKLGNQNLFTTLDHSIIRAAIKRLPGILSVVVEMRFWQKLTIYDIAFELGVSEAVVDLALKKASRLLRDDCLRNPAFSRSRYQVIEAIRSQAVA